MHPGLAVMPDRLVTNAAAACALPGQRGQDGGMCLGEVACRRVFLKEIGCT
jgi:hypothetical protein